MVLEQIATPQSLGLWQRTKRQQSPENEMDRMKNKITTSKKQRVKENPGDSFACAESKSERNASNIKSAQLNSLSSCKLEVAFFDLDDCLYKNNWATERKITTKIDSYLTSVLKLEPGSSNRLYRTYGTTIAGLIKEKLLAETEVQDFLNYGHDIELGKDIKPDPQLREMLKQIKCRRWVFSNSAPDHVERCLAILGIRDLFEGIIAASSVEMFSRCGYVTKPDPKCFRAAMDIAGVVDPKTCIFMDDSVRNIKTAKQLGWHAVLVGTTGRNGESLDCPEADAAIAEIGDLLKAIPELCTAGSSVLPEQGMIDS